ncbi:IS1 transposase [Leptolyngbya sp. O-77]|nr:IS1 transposase [Leptolyngbya sp. O-77]
MAIDADTREIIGCHIGERSRESAIALWQSILAVYRQCAKVYTDDWEAYVTVIPSKRHGAVGKESGLTSYIEHLNITLRQRISRLVRKTLSFSKKLENHIGAILVRSGRSSTTIIAVSERSSQNRAGSNFSLLLTKRHYYRFLISESSYSFDASSGAEISPISWLVLAAKARLSITLSG